MTAVDVRTPAGKASGSVELPAEIFDVQVNVPLIHQVVVAQLAAARQGTADTKTRAEVSGGGRKPYKQKGTGRARQGSIRAPQFTGGGVVHGPHPRDYSQRTPKKMKAAALRGALSDRARDGRIHVVTELVTGDAPSTKAAIAALSALGLDGNVLVAIDRDDDVSALSLRNVPSVHLIYVDQLNTYDVLVSDQVLFTSAALDAFLAGPTGKGKAVGTEPRKGGLGMRISDPRDILLAPVISEKSYGLLDENKYTFVVSPDANKTQIKIAVEQVFGVKVTSVNTLNREGKRLRTRTGFGRRAATKRAIVTVAAGDRIDIFGGPVS
ncbi:MAG: 50S ribosomal protein L4 [Actinobacteria bacterium]|nr:50S ribosomal protein L4 [Actinomycetota bacterium]